MTHDAKTHEQASSSDNDEASDENRVEFGQRRGFRWKPRNGIFIAEICRRDDVFPAGNFANNNFDSGHASLVNTSNHATKTFLHPLFFLFFRGWIHDGRVVPSENVCHMLGIQSHIPEIVVALGDWVRVRVQRISGVFIQIPNIWHTFSLGTSWQSRFRPQKQHLSTPWKFVLCHSRTRWPTTPKPTNKRRIRPTTTRSTMSTVVQADISMTAAAASDSMNLAPSP